VSLNFVTGGRYFREHHTPLQRMHNRSWRFADRWFQVKRLEKFTEKFFPRWDARYVMHPGLAVGYLRIGMAAMWAEGQIARPRELITWRPSRRAPADQENAVEAGS